MRKKPIIIQHVAGFSKIGGPATQLQYILNSRLNEKYQFIVLSQDQPAGGINLRLIYQMMRQILKVHPDLIHIRGLQNEGFHGVMAAYLAGCRRILVSVHGFAENGNVRSPISKWLLSQIFEPLSLILADRVYCVCKEATTHPIIKKYATSKCSVIYNGIRVTSSQTESNDIRRELGIDDEEVVAIFVGRLSKDKGLFILAEAAKRMERPPRILLVGDGPDTVRLEETFGPLMKTGQVKFLGRRDDIPKLLAASDFFVFPSFHENLSNALLEAMLARKAILTTQVGGNPEVVINGENGVLIPPNDISALANAMTHLSEHKELRDKMGQKGRERVEIFFSLEKTVSGLESVYDSMLDG